MTTNRVRVVVADDHEESLQVLANILRPEFEIVGTAINRDETAAAVGRLKPDVLVLGINMLLADGLHAARKFFKLLSHVHTIVLAVHADIEYEEAALGLGAAGGGGANKLFSAFGVAGRSTSGASTARFGSSKLLTRPINSCG